MKLLLTLITVALLAAGPHSKTEAHIPVSHLSIDAGQEPTDLWGHNLCGRLSSTAHISGNFQHAYEPSGIGPARFNEHGFRRSDTDSIEWVAPMRDWQLGEPLYAMIGLEPRLGHEVEGEVWTWTAPGAATKIHISLARGLTQGSPEYNYDGTPIQAPLKLLDAEERNFLATLIAESLGVLPQAVLASLPKDVHLVVVQDLGMTDPKAGDIAANAGYFEHVDAWTVQLSMKHGYGVPVQGGRVSTRAFRESDFEEILIHEFAHLIDAYYRVTDGTFYTMTWKDPSHVDNGWRKNPTAQWWEARQNERVEPHELVSTYAATNIKENFAETLTAWAAYRSGRLNPLREISTGCTLSRLIETKMPLELEWWDQRAIRAATSAGGSMFVCETYMDTDSTGLRKVDDRPANVEASNLPPCTMDDPHALHIVSGAGRADLVQQLIDDGADVHAKDYSGFLPIHRASNGDVVRLLIVAGANIREREEFNGRTPLHLAAANGHADVAQALIEAGANVNAKDRWQDEHGYTPLHNAQTADVARVLIAAGADVNVRADDGKTALDVALEKGRVEVAQVLREAGAIESVAPASRGRNVGDVLKDVLIDHLRSYT